jgi:polyphenol oxidase
MKQAATHCAADQRQCGGKSRLVHAEMAMVNSMKIHCPQLEKYGSRVGHAFFTRQGGYSNGLYHSLNAGLGSGDNRDCVIKNRLAIVKSLGVPNAFLATPRQTHSDIVLNVTHPWTQDRPVADAMVTGRPGIVLGILTADCGPVLMADAQAGVIGAAHAGWKGAIGDILENTVLAMESLGAARQRIVATLGPTISQANYETGPEFVERLIGQSPGNTLFFAESKREGHAYFDLPAYILARLRALEVAASWTGQCTYASENHFFSYRRAVHRGESDYGRQLSAILIRE